MKPGKMTFAVAMLSGMLTVPLMAQDAPREGGNPPAREGGGDGDGGGRRQRATPEEWRQQANERMKTSLGMSDEEYTAIQPKIESLRRVQRDATGPAFGFGFGGRGRGGGGGGGGDRNRGGGDNNAQQSQPAQSEVQTKARALQDAIEQKASDGEVVAKLDEFRAARAKAREEYKKAQEDIRQFLTKRQEAVLVSTGLLE